MIGKVILTSLLLVAFSVSSSCGDEGENGEVLEVWPAVRPDLKYRKLYQFQMNDDQKSRLMIEEWGSVEEQLYRLDLISDQQRVSYLSNGDTGEVWRYKPFICDQLEPNSPELSILANLFRGYSSPPMLAEQDPTINPVYGLGPLWLRASANKRAMRPCNSGENKKTEDLICWETSLTPPDYVIRFYFRSQKLEDLAAVIWAQPQSKDGKGEGKKGSIVARVKLVSVDTKHVDSTALQLPLGYGCRRKDQVFPQVSLQLLGEPGTTQQALLEVVLSRNLGDSHVTNNKWASRRHTLRLMRGTLDLDNPNRAYYVAVDQSRDAGRGFELKRRKRVWSAQNWSAREEDKEARIYTLDEVTGECEIEPMSLNNIIRMSFPNGPVRVAEEDLEEETSASLGLELIQWLFEDVEDYHLIRDQSEHLGEAGQLNISLYEKRLKQIRLNNGLWTGPISIVKKITLLIVKDQMEEIDTKPLHISLSVFFYSDDSTRILDKLVINLIENDLVDMSYMHKLMDVSACFSGRKSEPVVVKYPLESKEVAEALREIKDLVLELLLSNLFRMTPIEPVQVSNVEVSFDNFYMYFKFHLANLPLTETYDFQSGVELTLSKDVNVNKETFMEKISSCEEICATSCAHYNCLRFSYNPDSLICRLELVEATADFQQSPDGHLYTAPKPRMSESSAWNKLLGPTLANKPHLDPSILLKALRELTNLEISTWDSLPLVVKMRKSLLLGIDGPDDDDKDVLLLKPISVHSEFDLIGEIADAPMARESELQIEYSVLMENREFKKNKAFERYITETTYEVCAQACEANDCRSFSYCEAKQTCSLTNLHSSKDIEAATDQRHACRVFVVDYLSKFEDFGPVMATARVAKVVQEKGRAADCATACMEESRFACQGFYHCKDNTCLLQDVHALEEESTDRLMLAIGEPEMQQKQKCRLYSRSYLSHFNDYYGKALKEVENQPEQVSLGAEQCAQKCIRQSCLAFHVCHEITTGQVGCQISSDKKLRRDQVESRDHCTTFVLSDKSQYNLFKKKANFREPDKQSAIEISSGNTTGLIVVDKDEAEAIENDINSDLLADNSSGLQNESKLRQSSNWFDKVMSFFYGSLLGVCLGLAWKKHDDIYLFTTRTFSHFSGRS